MTKLIKYTLLILAHGIVYPETEPIKVTITGKVLNKNIVGLKGVNLIIEDGDGKNLGEEKSGRSGKFKFKK